MSWEVLILPLLVVVVWYVGWARATRRLRLWFAFLTPVVTLLTLVLIRGPKVGSCPESCPGGAVANWAASTDSALSGGLLGNLAVTLIVSALLLAVTLVVETALLVRRSEAAERRDRVG